MRHALSAALVAGLLGNAAAAQTRPGFHHLEPTPQNVAWGYYDAAAAPVLHIASGDTVEAHTLITSSPARLEGIAGGARSPSAHRDSRPGVGVAIS